MMIRRFVLAVLLFCCVLCLAAQSVDEAWVKSHYEKQEYYIPMRDGVHLFTAVYKPRESKGGNPFLVMRTPYSCSPYGVENYNSGLWNSHWSEYLREGYILVFQDVRGKYMSEGDFMDVRPYNPKKKGKETDEASDAYDTVDWLLKHVKGNNGRVGVWGNSYCGFYPVMAALSHHPAIVAVNPQAPVADWFMGDDFHHNGAFFLSGAFGFFGRHGLPRKEPVKIEPTLPSIQSTDEYSFFLRMGAVSNLSAYMGDSIVFWNEMMQHGNYDEWWQARNLLPHCRNIRAAVLLTGGFFDAEDWYGTLNIGKSLQNNSGGPLHLVYGPWSHGGWNGRDGSYLGDVRFGENHSGWYKRYIEFPFFQTYLKNIGHDTLALATIFFSGENRWHTFDSWPPRGLEYSPLYFSQSGHLSFVSPEEEGYTSYVSDPAHPVPYIARITASRKKEYMTGDQRFASFRPDVITFETDSLSEDLTLAGPITADLKISIGSTDVDMVVKVIDVFPDGFSYDEAVDGRGGRTSAYMSGYQMLVRGDVMRGRYRKSFECPEPFDPGKVETVRFVLPDVAHTFRKGHRLMVQIQSSWFPLVDRNPQQFVDIYHCSDADFVPTEVSVHHSPCAASKLLLPILKNIR